ncbi:hypothetical protein D9758_000502 [Tetrapyrgos nigripes]|uniref:Transcription initiation factor TFIID subunit 2 n=1 Tax=Tetrapyrgos nigripes TaxID=182062 RepID=A0A8H5LZ76_9AGAR|nr:hypothetical protein D9758_000502 [Tetrapyrgos nigripes]
MVQYVFYHFHYLQSVTTFRTPAAIHSVHFGSHEAEFVHHDSLCNIAVGQPNEPPDCHKHPELKRKLYSALQEDDDGGLSISIPEEVPLKSSGSTGMLFNDVSTPEPQTPGPQSTSGQTITEFAPITVKIIYSLRKPVEGIQFVLPTDSHPHRVPHAYTTPSSPDAARCWVPCVDNLWEKCTWEFEFVVPRYLEERQPHQEDEPDDAIPTVVICSGDLVEQVAHPYNSNKTIFLFSQAVLTSVQHIAFAAGPFHLHSIPPDVSADDTTSGSSQPLMYGFCLPGQESFLSTSTSTLRSAMNFYTNEFGSYPFGSYKIVFVDELPTQRLDSSTLTLATVDLLHGEDAIDQAIETRQVLSHALACQWVGINIQPKTWSDLWLVNGLAGYINGLFLRKLFGNNEYRFRLRKDMDRCLEWDNGSMPPICQPQLLDPPDSRVLPFINLKAPLVLHILDRRLGKSGTSLGLSRILPKLFLSAISGEMQNNCLSTHAFLRMCRKVSGVDPRSFAEQWIYGSGCPSFSISASFNRKKMAVEITMRQECTAYLANESDEIGKTLLKPVHFFEGTMTIRIHEADGTPYEHVLDIRSPFKRYEVPFNTKYKRVRRNTKRYLARQAAAQAAAEGDTEAAEAMGMVDMGFGLEVWEKESERENWKVADWTEEDEGVMSGATYEWIRMDADFEWIAKLSFEQPDFMWVSQLQRDRDVVAQLEAVHALARQPTAIVSSTLTKTVLVSNYHYRIRCEAALALVHCSIRQLDFLGLFHLFKLFLRYCYDSDDPKKDLFSHTYVPKPNDFSDLSEYLVRKSLVNAISRIRFENGKSPSVVRQFLIDQLRYNDNTANPYSDAFYICTVISAAACSAVSTAPPERGELLPSEVRTQQTAEDEELLKQTISEVDRYRSMDRLIPSYHNIVTIAALEFHMVLGVASLTPSNPRVFFPLTREGNYVPVRIAAFDGLFLTKWFTPPIMKYVLSVIANDSSRVIRRIVARNACQSLALLAQMGEMKSNLKDHESLLIEEDGSHPEKSKESKKTELDAMIKVLRKDREVGKNEVLREFVMPIALTPSLPTPKIAVKPPIPPPMARVIKSGGPPKSPVNIPPKLKLSAPATPVESRRSSVSRGGTPKVTTAALPEPPRLKIGPTVPSTSAVAKGKNKKFTKPTSKSGNVPKAQSSGMSPQDVIFCRSALKKLMGNKHAPLFKRPVDPIRDQAPKYFDIIKNPMDLSTMSAKIDNGLYKDRFQFQSDFKLIIQNAKTYNVAGSFVHNEAIAFETFFEKQWTIMSKTLEAKAQAQPREPPKPAPKERPPVPIAKFSPPPQPPAAATSRPAIKLKLGPQNPPQHQQSVAPKIKIGRATASQAEPSATNLPHRKKVKEAVNQRSTTPDPVADVDAPPPPYIDDGSHDLYQEVLAIEREKDEAKRQRAQEKVLTNGSSSKRKKDDIEEDEILALAQPAKRERPSPVDDRTAGPALKLLPAKPLPARSVSRTPSDAPRPPSVKGKEKEATPSSTPAPSKSKKPLVAQATPLNDKKCRDVLKTLQKAPEAYIFLRPVDPKLDGCPTYYEEIKNPMDLGTMSGKLNSSQYTTMEDFRRDVELIFSNCRQFNPPGTAPVLCADALEKFFRKEWSKVIERKLSWVEKRGLQGIMSTLVKEPVSWVFREPVDPVLLGIPTYFEVIPQKDARDLRTIRQKLDSDKYESVDAFEADIALMIRNAIVFNGAESEVGSIAVQLKDRFQELLSTWKAGGTKKRKDGGEKLTSQPSKKVKLG